MDLFLKFKQYIQKEKLFQSKDRLLLAVSGGVDSVVLCELCRKAGYYFEMAHCNFQLRGNESERDELFVRSLAQKYDVPFHLKKFDTASYAKQSKKSVEEAARDLRYEWFHSLLHEKAPHGDSSIKCNYILTAHHADDNIETVLMNFFRGTGIAGIVGMLPKQGKIIRPLLFARRTEIEQFAEMNGLAFVTDHTNLENDYTRNYFRNSVIPLITKKYPEATANVLKNIHRFHEAFTLYNQAVDQHKSKLLEQKGNEIHIAVLKLLKTIPLATILHEIIKEFGFTAHQTDEVIGLLKSETGKYVRSGTHRIIRNRNWLIISPVASMEAGHILIEEGDKLVKFKNGCLSINKILNEPPSLSNDPQIAQLDLSLITFPLLLRKCRKGDYFYPLGMQKKKKLSRFFTDQKLSPPQKENSMVIEMNKKIIWVVGMRIDDRFKIKAITTNIYLIRLSRTNN